MNHLLGTERPTPFDFLISGTFLRTSLDEFLTANGLSSESTLTVEYVRSILPPLHVRSFEHDEWLSAVDVLSRNSPAGVWGGEANPPAAGRERIVSASYDGHLRVWDMSSHVLAVSPSTSDGRYTHPVKAARFMSSSRLVSSGLDRVIRIWDYSESQEENKAELKPILELYGHRASVDALAVHAPSSRILSASVDHTVGLWTTKKSEAPAADEARLPSASASKKRKLTSPSNVPKRGPLAQFKSHSQPVSGVIFAHKDPTVAYSTSWDSTVCTWDLPTASLVDTRTTQHPLFSVTELATLNLVAAGSSARHITLIDPRASATTVSAMTLRGHMNSVVALAPDPHNSFGLVSGSHDGTCRIWDVRSTKPGRAQESAGMTEGAIGQSVYTIPRETSKGQPKPLCVGHGYKVFDVVWDATVGITSASEDKRVQINRAPNEVSLDGEKAWHVSL